MMPKDQICEIISVQPNGDIEDGISEDIERALATSGDPVDEWDWALVWRLVFPADKDVPDPGKRTPLFKAPFMRDTKADIT